MAPPQRSSGRVLARDIVAYPDTELNQYLEEHRLEGGGATVVHVEDPENLPETFIQRLRDRARHPSNAAPSHPIDLDQVTARLLLVPADKASPHSRYSSSSRGSSVDTLPPFSTKEIETENYHKLVDGAGRPLYPIDLIHEVAWNPLAHWDMLRPWVDCNTDPDPNPDAATNPGVDWGVFGTQLSHWEGFRRWQTHNRREGRPRYVEIDSLFASTDRAYNTFVKNFRRGSPNYTEAAKKLLAQYDFTRPFQLQVDSKQQDELATWIEYLVYAYAEHYELTRLINRLQPDYNVAWKTLVDSAVLRPSETEEYICDDASASQRQSEEDVAEKAVRSAEVFLGMALKNARGDPRRSRVTSSAHAWSLATGEGQSRLDAAKVSLKSVQRRNDLITTFRTAATGYLTAKEDAERHSIRLRWILEQLPLIEAELERTGVAQGRSHTGHGTKRGLTHDQDDEVTNDRRPQKRSRTSRISSLTKDSAESPGPARTPSIHSRGDDMADDERPLKRLRTSHSDDAPKATPRNQTVARKNTRLRGSATNPTKASTLDRGPNRSKRAPGAPVNVPRGTRSSRRLAGDPPEFGMVLERRGALPLYEPFLQQPSAGSQRSQRAVKGAKPQSISRSRETRTASTKRSAKRL